MKREYVSGTKDISRREISHLQKLRAIAAESMVLLKNDGTLPLKESQTVALFGSGARRTVKGGIGSGDVNVRHSVSVEEGLVNSGFNIASTAWMDAYDKLMDNAKQQFVMETLAKAKQTNVHPMMLFMSATFTEPAHDITDSIDLNALKADTAIYVLARSSGEGKDRNLDSDYNLTETEKNDITFLASKFHRFILVLNVGNVINITTVKDDKNINAILLMSQCGSAGGDVLCDIILGKTTPSGKLTATWARDYYDYPFASSFSHIGGDLNDSYYREGIYVGYRYFDTFNITPAYEFGYGLSYTDFFLAPVNICVSGTTVTISATVKNTGNYSGKEIVQVYYSAPQGKLDRPYQELAAFVKTETLSPGESQSCLLSFDVTEMASYCKEYESYILEKGLYYIRIGNSSRNTYIAAALYLNKETKILTVKNHFENRDFKDLRPDCQPYSYLSEAAEKANAKIIELDIQNNNKIINYTTVKQEIADTKTKEKITLPMIKSGKYTFAQLVAQLTPFELASLCCGAYRDDTGFQVIGNASVSIPGAAGETTSYLLNSRAIPNIVMADGPAGLRILAEYYADENDNFVYSESSAIAGAAEIMGGSSDKPDLGNAKLRYQYASAIPIATALAQTWNIHLLYQTGKIVGDEMAGFGISLWLAPGMNIQRNPLCGRNFEYYSEDPYLSGKYAASITKGVQTLKGTGTTIKHFACNNQEANRNYNNSHVSERALREIYLKAFELAIKESDPVALMTSYNLLNGEHTANSHTLLQHIVRDEWKYDGLIMSDWGTTGNGGHYDPDAKYPSSEPSGCIKSGNDIIMPGTKKDIESILAALNNPDAIFPITLPDLQYCALNILKTIAKLTQS